MFIHKYSDATITNDGIERVKSFPAWGVALIIIVIVAIAAIIGTFIYIRRRNKRLENQLVEEYSKVDGEDDRKTDF